MINIDNPKKINQKNQLNHQLNIVILKDFAYYEIFYEIVFVFFTNFKTFLKKVLILLYSYWKWNKIKRYCYFCEVIKHHSREWKFGLRSVVKAEMTFTQNSEYAGEFHIIYFRIFSNNFLHKSLIQCLSYKVFQYKMQIWCFSLRE